MRTTVSIPDSVFKAAEQLAQQLGISRSELYTTAVASYVEEYLAKHVTEQLNRLYAIEDSSLDEVVEKLQAVSLPQEEW